MSSLARRVITNHERKLRLIFRLIRGVESFLGPEDDWVEDDRRRLFEWLQKRYGDSYTFVYHIDDTDYVTSVPLSPDEVDVLLHNNSYERNLVSGRKYRTYNGSKQWAHASWARYYIPEQQHHVFLFENEDNGTDIYAHYEDDVVDPAAHLHIRDDDDDIVGMQRADPGPLYDIFEREGVETYQNV